MTGRQRTASDKIQRILCCSAYSCRSKFTENEVTFFWKVTQNVGCRRGTKFSRKLSQSLWKRNDRETAKSVLHEHWDSSTKLHGVISQKNHNLDTHCHTNINQLVLNSYGSDVWRTRSKEEEAWNASFHFTWSEHRIYSDWKPITFSHCGKEMFEISEIPALTIYGGKFLLSSNNIKIYSFWYISNEMQYYTVIYFWKTALHVSGGISTHHT